MKTLAMCLAISLLAGPATAVLYTNVAAGATLTVSSDVSEVDSTPISDEIGITYDGGSGTGALQGSGNLTFDQKANSTTYNLFELIGISGHVAISNYTGNLRVANDINSVANSGAGQIYAKSMVKGIFGNTTGNLNGDLTVTAVAGSATSAGSDAGAYTEAYGIHGNLAGDIIGRMNVSAISGTANSTGGVAYVYAQAYGIKGDMTGNITGDITVAATAGTAIGTAAEDYPVEAVGIDGANVQIANFSGNITATATAEKNINGAVTTAGTVNAYGIRVTDTLSLTAAGGSIHAAIAAPDAMTLDDLPVGSAAYALLGGAGADAVSLTDMDLIGDMDLAGGNNQLLLAGNTRLQGNIAASGGDMDLQISSGMFTPVGTVRVSDLAGDQMTITATGGLDLELYEAPSSDLNSKLAADGDVVITEGASLAARAAAGQDAANIIGNAYEVVTGSNITGTFVESEQSMFIGQILQNGTNITYVADGLRAQEGASTPMGSSVTKATVTAANAVMNSLSARSGGMRSILRVSANPGEEPEGSGGPSELQTLTDGQWLVYVRQFNDIGSQDADGSLDGFDWNTSGFTIGAEKLVDDGVMIGTAAGGAWTDIDGDEGPAGGASDMAIASVYANLFSDSWYTDLGLSYAHAWNDTQRVATDTQRYMGEYESDLFGAWIEFGCTLAGEKFRMEPYARSTYISGNHNGYTDKGGTNPLTVDDNGTDNWLAEAGLRGRRKWALENGGQLALELKAGWQHELLDATVSANGSLLGVDQTLRSPSADRNALALSANVDWQVRDTLNLSVEYAPTVADNWINHGLNLAIKYRF